MRMRSSIRQVSVNGIGGPSLRYTLTCRQSSRSNLSGIYPVCTRKFVTPHPNPLPMGEGACRIRGSGCASPEPSALSAGLHVAGEAIEDGLPALALLLDRMSRFAVESDAHLDA